VDVRGIWSGRPHAAGAVHLSKGIIERDIEQDPRKAQKIVLYCGGGFRSRLRPDALQKMGYTSVISARRRWRAWNEPAGGGKSRLKGAWPSPNTSTKNT